METKYEFEVRAKHLQSTSVEVADSSSLKKLKNQLNESCLPDFVASQVSLTLSKMIVKFSFVSPFNFHSGRNQKLQLRICFTDGSLRYFRSPVLD